MKKRKKKDQIYEATVQCIFKEYYIDMDIESMPEDARLVVKIIKMFASEKNMTSSRALGLLSDAKKIVPLVAKLY